MEADYSRLRWTMEHSQSGLNIRRHFLLLAAVALAVAADAMADVEDVLGRWKAVDGVTGETTSLVELYLEGDELSGRIVEVFTKAGEDENPVCAKCPGERKGKPIEGMVIISGMKKQGNRWLGGEILDPGSGNVFPCQIWLEGRQLKVRGYVFIFFRTHTWIRVGGE